MTLYRAIGLMSGTSLDGIDAALIETDGASVVRRLGGCSLAYDASFRAELRKAISGEIDPTRLEERLTDFHADAVEALLVQTQGWADLIGFHGQTVLHRPEERRTWQIGDGQRLADRTGVDVVYDFRSADVAAGGQGAPLAPVYHAALAAGTTERPLAIVNIGGVGNVTWVGADGALVAFDTGPGNGPIDDWVGRAVGERFDAGGARAKRGKVHIDRVETALAGAYFGRPAPKSLDRLDFTDRLAEGLATDDGAATLTEFTARTILECAHILPEPPKRWLITGGGRRNDWLMSRLRHLASAPVDPIEAIDADGDMLEAEAFAYMAVRHLSGAPISFPGTTGVPTPLAGGRLARAAKDRASSRLAG